MAKYDSDDMVLKLQPSGGGGYVTIAGCISHSCSISNGTVDLSDKDSNRWGDKGNFGPRELNISFNGWVNDGTQYALLESAAQDDTVVDLQLAYSNGRTVTCNFYVSQFDWAGDHGNGQTFSCTLATDGEPTFA
jgi:predicted secreted protein